MTRSYSLALAAALGASLAGPSAWAVNTAFTHALTFDQINFDGQNGTLVTGTSAGSDAFFLLRGGAAGQRYVKIADVTGAKTGSVFGDGSVFADPDINGAGDIAGDIDHFGSVLAQNDPTSDTVFTFDIATGAFTKLVTEAAGDAWAGGTWNPNFGAIDPADGSYVVYDSTSDNVGRISGGAISTVLTAAQLTTLISDSIATSLTVLPSGDFIISDADGGPPVESFYLVDPVAETSSVLVDETHVIAALAAEGVVVTDIGILSTTDGLGPDGRFYFAEINADAILSFDPSAATPSSTLRIDFLATTPEAASAFFVSNLVFVDGVVGWVNAGTASANAPFRGLYLAIPEPAAALLAAVAGCGLAARRR